MIRQLNFWRSWSKTQQLLLAALGFLTITLLGLLIGSFYWVQHPNMFFDTATELNYKFIDIPDITLNGVDFISNEKVFYLKEWYLATNPSIASWVYTLFLAALILGTSLLLAGASYLKGILSGLGFLTIGLFMLFLSPGVLIDVYSQWPFLLGFVLLSLAYMYFQSYAKTASFLLRFIVIVLLLTGFIAYFIYQSAFIAPMAALSAQSLPFALVIFAVFLFLIAHEAYLAVVWAVSNGAVKGRSSLLTFISASILFLLNCLLVYLENKLTIEESPFILSPIWLFLLSTVLGFWGFRKQYEDQGLFAFSTTGFGLFFGLSIMSIALWFFAFLTHNDSLYLLLDDYTSMVHLVMSVVFFGYIIINFWQLFKQGFNVHLVVYKPKLSRLLLAKTLAVFLLGFLLIQKNIYSYNQAKAAISLSKADSFLLENDATGAESYLKEAIQYDFYSQKGNYTMATLAKAMNDQTSSIYYFKQGTLLRPSEQSFVGLSQSLEREELYFDALFTLKEGLKAYPESAILATNTARLLEKASVMDSVYYYRYIANENCQKCEVEQVNLQAFWIENGLSNKLDSTTKALKQNGYLANEANQLAIAKITGNAIEQESKPVSKSDINTAEFAHLYNTITQKGNQEVLPDSIWTAISSFNASAGLTEELLYLKALQEFQFEDKSKGLKQLAYLAQDSSITAQMYKKDLAMWLLKEGLYDKSKEFFLKAGEPQTVEILENTNFALFLDNRQQQQADELLQSGLTMDNYKSLIKKAPFNAYLVAAVSDFLVKNKKELEAYTLTLNAAEWNESNSTLWKKQVELAVKNGVPDYAETGLVALQQLLPVADYLSFYQLFEKLKSDFNSKEF